LRRNKSGEKLPQQTTQNSPSPLGIFLSLAGMFNPFSTANLKEATNNAARMQRDRLREDELLSKITSL